MRTHARRGSVLHRHDMTVKRRKFLVQLDDARVAALDQRGAATGSSRSDVVREAIDRLLGTGDVAAIDAAIVSGYEESPAPAPGAWTSHGAIATIRAEPW